MDQHGADGGRCYFGRLLVPCAVCLAPIVQMQDDVCSSTVSLDCVPRRCPSTVEAVGLPSTGGTSGHRAGSDQRYMAAPRLISAKATEVRICHWGLARKSNMCYRVTGKFSALRSCGGSLLLLCAMYLVCAFQGFQGVEGEVNVRPLR